MKKKKIYKIIFIILPFILSCLFHFIYDLVPFPLFAIYFPVNESIFEHTKLTFTPLIITYLIFYFILKNKLDLKRYYSSLIISISISLVSMLALFYSYKIFTGEDIALLNILALLMGLVIGQLVSIYTYNKKIYWSIDISIFCLLTMTTIFLILTINPPLLEFFCDKTTNSYGLY